jgi:hypothetical protein
MHTTFVSPATTLHLETPAAQHWRSDQDQIESAQSSLGKRKRGVSVSQNDSELWRKVEGLETELQRRDNVEEELKSEIKRLQMETETLMKIVANLTQKNA